MNIYEDNLNGLNNIETYEREDDDEMEENTLPVVEKMDDSEDE